MLRKLGLVLVVVALALGAVPLIAQNQGPPLAIPDQWGMGCVSCHSAQAIGETLNVTLGKLDHPNINRSVSEVPTGCVTCHRGGALAPLVHKAHYPVDAKAGAPVVPCLACHRMNPATGVPESKVAPKNW